jgi:hypothetical protein
MQTPDNDWTPGDQIDPFYCARCRKHIPGAVSRRYFGMCLDCFKASREETASTLRLQGDPTPILESRPLRNAVCFGVPILFLLWLAGSFYRDITAPPVVKQRPSAARVHAKPAPAPPQALNAHPASETPSTSVTPWESMTKPGDSGYIAVSGEKYVLAASTVDNLDALIKVAAAHDTVGLGDMMLQHRVLGIDSGTPVLVIDMTIGSRRVRFMGGPYQYQTGWVPMEWVHKTEARPQ